MPPSRILVVEDEGIIALNLREQLLSLGYDVPPAVASGEQALRHIDASPPDLILMDINLKGTLDGIATATRIPAALGIPLIYLTAYSSDATLSRAAATNPYGYLLKPFSARELHAMIQVSLARCRTDRATANDMELRLRTRKMDALRELAGGVADEVSDLLTVLYEQLDVLGHRAIGDPALLQPIQEAFSLAIEKEGLMRQMRDFAGRSTLTPASVKPREFVNALLPRLGIIVGDGVSIRLHCPDDLRPMRIDPGQLGHALANLAQNAREAMEQGGSLTIECQNVALDPGPLRADDTETDRYVLLSVRDTGIGMTGHVIERAFEPFFTTKPAGAASGLGLSLVFGFIRQSGGHISIDSKPGAGTTVRLYLPAAPAETPIVAPQNDASPEPEANDRHLGEWK